MSTSSASLSTTKAAAATIIIILQGGHKPGKPGVLRDFSERGKLQGILGEFCATSRKNCNKQIIFTSSFKCLCKTAVDWANRIIRIIRISGSSDPAQ